MIRGDVHEYVDRGTVGHEQAGRRYCVVLQSSHLLPSSTVLVAPTSLSALEQTYRPRVTVLNQRTSVLVEQIKATDVSRLGRKVGQLSMEELWTVDDAIKDVLGLT
jgi:mRNA interferase MazF